jgi:hypothetical protein
MWLIDPTGTSRSFRLEGLTMFLLSRAATGSKLSLTVTLMGVVVFLSAAHFNGCTVYRSWHCFYSSR